MDFFEEENLNEFRKLLYTIEKLHKIGAYSQKYLMIYDEILIRYWLTKHLISRLHAPLRLPWLLWYILQCSFFYASNTIIYIC